MPEKGSSLGLKNGPLYGILSVPLVAFGVCGYILLHWGNAEVYGVVFALDAPAAFGIFLRLRNDGKSWHQISTPIPRENPLYPRTNELATKMGVSHHDLYVADSTLMVMRKAVGAVTTGIRKTQRHVLRLFPESTKPRGAGSHHSPRTCPHEAIPYPHIGRDQPQLLLCRMEFVLLLRYSQSSNFEPLEVLG